MAKKKLPPLFLLVPNAGRHVHRVAIVRTRDEYGRPLQVELQHDIDKPISLIDKKNMRKGSDQVEFITMYVTETITQKIR